MRQVHKTKKGFSLLEVILAIAIFSGAAISVGYLIIDASKATDVNSKKIAATLLAREGLEVVSSIRDSGSFNDLDAGTYGLYFDDGGETWSLVEDDPDTSDGIYVRTITIEDDSIIGSVDIKKVTSSVTAESGARDITSSLTTYFTDWQ